MIACILLAVQTILSGILIDANTQAPIDNAFVFITNSSNSTTTDTSGIFQLDIGNLEQGEVVITHLNYETKSIPIASFNNATTTITLTPKQQDITTVLVATKGSNLKKRKRWMKRFYKGFFGSNINSKDISFLNPEVIWFQEVDHVLKAEAIDYLSIFNRALGYKLRIYLEKFKMDKQETVLYAGSVFFEDVLPEMPKPEKCAKRRATIYNQSKHHFLKFLWTGTIDSTRYEFGFGKLDEQEKLVDFEPTDLSQLKIKRTGNQLTLYTHQYFVFADKAILAGNTGLGTIARYANCFLKSPSGKIIINRRGEIINAQEVEESGYWIQKRMVKLLPIDYRLSK